MGYKAADASMEIADAIGIKASTGMIRELAGWTLANASICEKHGLAVIFAISPKRMNEAPQSFESAVEDALCVAHSAKDMMEGVYDDEVLHVGAQVTLDREHAKFEEAVKEMLAGMDGIGVVVKRGRGDAKGPRPRNKRAKRKGGRNEGR